jgi:alanyl aminopeptidase
MFARFVGEERFRAAVRSWLAANTHGTGTTDGLLAEISRAAGRDLAGPFKSFLDRPGVPLVAARIACDGSGARLDLSQSRWLPVGSSAPGDVRWQVPVCARFEAAGSVREACAMLDGARGTLPLPACPAWAMPNAGAAGYYRWALGPEDLARLRDQGLAHLSPPERLSYADALAAAARSARLPWAEAMAGLVPVAADPVGAVAAAPMRFLEATEEQLVSEGARPRARALASALYRPHLAELGWDPRPDEPLERRRLRQEVVEFLVWTARDPEVRREAARRGLAYAGVADGHFHPESVSLDLAEVALAAAVDEGDEALFSALEARLFATQDGETRQRILDALGRATAPALSARALRLAGDPRLRVNERAVPLHLQGMRAETREAAFRSLPARFDALVATLSPIMAGRIPRIFRGFCDSGKAEELRAFFGPRLERFPGARGPLAQVAESIELCAALRQAQGASAEASLAARQAGAPPRGSARLGR